MEENAAKINEHVNSTEFPFWLVPKLQSIGLDQTKNTNLETGAIAFEMAKVDGSIATFYLVHGMLAVQVINALGDEE